MTYATENALLDVPWIAPATLTLFGFSLAQWVLIFAFLYGAVRLAMVCTEFYWKWKDRRVSQAHSNGTPARAGSRGSDGNDSANGNP